MDANQIHLSGEFVREEGLASGTITPGMLVEQTSATAPTFRAHATEGGFAERAFAVEDALQGKTVTDNYATTTRVSVNVYAPGARVNALVAGGSHVSIGEHLTSGADGMLIPVGDVATHTDIKQDIAVALEAFSQTDAGLVAVRIL